MESLPIPYIIINLVVRTFNNNINIKLNNVFCYFNMMIYMLTLFSNINGGFLLFGTMIRHIYFEPYYQFNRTNVHIR